MTDEEHPYQWAVDTPPIGEWTTPLHPLVYDDLRFDEDGTGLLTSHSGMFGEEHVPFEWRHEGPGRIRIRDLHDDEFPFPGKDGQYGVLHYRTDWIGREAGKRTPILRSVEGNGFWRALAPIFFVRQVSTGAPPRPSSEAEVAAPKRDDPSNNIWISLRRLLRSKH